MIPNVIDQNTPNDITMGPATKTLEKSDLSYCSYLLRIINRFIKQNTSLYIRSDVTVVVTLRYPPEKLPFESTVL